MSDRSHAPLHVPGRTPTEIEEAILRVRADNPEWGAKTILKVLENNGYMYPHSKQHSAKKWLYKRKGVTKAQGISSLST